MSEFPEGMVEAGIAALATSRTAAFMTGNSEPLVRIVLRAALAVAPLPGTAEARYTIYRCPVCRAEQVDQPDASESTEAPYCDNYKYHVVGDYPQMVAVPLVEAALVAAAPDYRAENERLREALRWYENAEAHEFNEDGGERAHVALDVSGRLANGS